MKTIMNKVFFVLVAVVMMVTTNSFASTNTVAPTITVNTPSGSTIESGTIVTVTVDGKGSKITKVESTVNGKLNTFTLNNLGINLKCGPFDTAGTHKVVIMAQNEAGLRTTKTFTYYVEAEKDTTAPTMTATPVSGSTLMVGERVKIVVHDAESLVTNVTYSWNNGTEKSLTPNLNKYNMSMETFVSAGTHKLEMTVRNADGKEATKTFTYYVEAEADTTAPTVTADKTSGSTIEAGTTVKVIVSDNESNVTKVVCTVNGKANTFTPNKAGITINCGSFNTPGTHKIVVEAENADGLKTTKTFTYYIEAEADTTAPTVTADKTSGSTIEAGTTVKVTVSDNESNVTKVVCTINGKANTFTPNKAGITINCGSFNTPGTHKIVVEAENADGLKTTKTFTYYVEPEEEEDTTAPTITPNPASGSTLMVGDKVSLVVRDPESLVVNVTYKWNNYEEKVLTPNKNIFNMTMEEFGGAGTYKLVITAENAEGLKTTNTFTYYVEAEEEEDKTAPSITADTPSGSTLKPGTAVKITVQDNESEITKVEVKLNDKLNTFTPNVNIYDINCGSFKTPGTYKIVVTGENAEGLKTTKTFTYYVEAEEEEDKTAPSITTDTPSGSTLKPGATVKITVQDNESKITKVEYKLNGELNNVVPNVNIYDIEFGPFNNAGTYKIVVTGENAEGLKTTKTFTYYVEAEEEEDKTAPSVTTDTPSGSTLKPGAIVKITVQDNESLVNEATYKLNGEVSIDMPNVNIYDIEFGPFNDVGTYKIEVTGKNEAGLKTSKTFVYYVEAEKDTEAPTISMNPADKSTVNGGKVIKATLRDNVELASVKYYWKGQTAKTLTFTETDYEVINLPAISDKAGTYYMYITVKDKAGNPTTEMYVYYVEDDEEDNDVPVVDADPSKGTLEYGDRILITAEDDDGIEYVEYYWDDEDDEVRKYDDEFTVKVPSEEGKHYLFVRAMDEKGNRCEYERFVYTIEENNYPGNPDIMGELNSRVRELRVEIRNADDKIKFEPEEEILYYVDYYNGSSSKVSNAKIVVELPTYLKGLDASDDGKVTSSKITWNLGTLNKGEYGRVSFTAMYTSEKYNEKILTIPAKIYSGSSLKDSSNVRNLIYCDDGKGTGSHEAYCIGYPEGTFRPNDNITRAELATMIANIEGLSSVYRGGYADVDGHWAANSIQACIERGYVNPLGYNFFGAEECATRADVAYAIAAILGVEDLEPIFVYSSDVEYSDARCAMEQLLRLGIMDGYSDGTSRPQNNIIRAEVVTIINNYLFRGELYPNGYRYSYNYENNYNYGGEYYILKFTDLTQSHWAYGHIMEATNDHRYVRVIDGNESML